MADDPRWTWSIPGLREDPTMCLRCRAALALCGKPVCPILLRYDALARAMPSAPSRTLEGSSPPAVFVGRYGYPKVSIGPLLSGLHGDTMLLDTPEEWVGRPLTDIIAYRTGLVRGTRRAAVTEAVDAPRWLEELQLLARSAESVDAEAEFRRAPRGRISLSDSAPPFGPSAPLESVALHVRRVDPHIDRLHDDGDALARTAVRELYARGVRVSRIQRAFSAGNLGRQPDRKLVPTRWSITAVDDMLSKENLARVRLLPEIGEIRLYEYVALDNRWAIVLLPGAYRYESIETWYPGTLWNPSESEIVMLSDHEGHRGRTSYASIGGCYYAARLASSEALLRLNRQAGVLILREVHPGALLPLGVWNVREHVRAALDTRSVPVPDLKELQLRLAEFFAIPLPRWRRQSALLRDALEQRRLEEFDPSVPAPASAG
jgi:hypothetical protein